MPGIVFRGNIDAYNTRLTMTAIATGRMLQLTANSPGICFTAGTLIKTAKGNRAIEEIQAGDLVWAENPETGEKGLKEVVQTFVNETTELIHITVKGQKIHCTRKHPFYVPIKGWTAACHLRAGDILVTVNGEYVVVEQVQHEILENPVTVYNFEVKDYHTYYVGQDGVLVNNKCENEPKSPVKLTKHELKGVDAHKFKAEIVTSVNQAQFDIYKDTANNNILWLEKSRGHKWVETGYQLRELYEFFLK